MISLTRSLFRFWSVAQQKQIDVQTLYVDKPPTDDTWDEGGLLLASEYRLTLDQAHQMLARAFPHVYRRK